MNFPKNKNELKVRLDLIRQGIPNQGNNKKFAIPAFQLFIDCGLNTPENTQESAIGLCSLKRENSRFGRDF